MDSRAVLPNATTPATGPAAGPAASIHDVQIEEGAALVWFAYDLGHQIDLDRAQQRVAAGVEREQIRHEHRAPPYFQFEPAPLRIADDAPPIALGALATDGHVEATLYDFGAVSIAYRIPMGPRSLEQLADLAGTLDDNPQLLADSRDRVERLLRQLGDAIENPRIADLVEDYTVFHARRWSPPVEPARIVDEHRAIIARILRCEREPMSPGELDDALQVRLAYGVNDDVVIDWNGAFVFDALGEDTLAVLEFANVELLEMRFLDDRLDAALEQSHAVVRARRRSPFGRPRDVAESMRRIARLQIESAILFESVNNAIKLLGDQFLARLYRLAARRLHLDEWDANILRKLETIENIYEKLSDESSTRRMELLEWIVIILITLEIVFSFVIPH
jgi:hypothetical protein